MAPNTGQTKPMAARSEHGRRRPVGGGRVQRAAVTPEVASRALPRQQPAAAAAPAAEWGAAAATPARSGSHLRRRCQNGFSSSRGGFQSRWHSLVNCDYGDSTTSRFDSPAAAVSWRGAGWGSVEGEHRGGARAPLDGSLWPTPMPGAAQERVMAPSPRSTAPRRRPATRRRSASGTAQPRPCADGARRLVLVPPLPHRSTSVSGVRPIHRTPPDLVVGTVLNPHGAPSHTFFQRGCLGLLLRSLRLQLADRARQLACLHTVAFSTVKRAWAKRGGAECTEAGRWSCLRQLLGQVFDRLVRVAPLLDRHPQPLRRRGLPT
jgi:hypothetical protein